MTYYVLRQFTLSWERIYKEQASLERLLVYVIVKTVMHGNCAYSQYVLMKAHACL